MFQTQFLSLTQRAIVGKCLPVNPKMVEVTKVKFNRP